MEQNKKQGRRENALIIEVTHFQRPENRNSRAADCSPYDCPSNHYPSIGSINRANKPRVLDNR
jgi:hypothetical protein